MNQPLSYLELVQNKTNKHNKTKQINAAENTTKTNKILTLTHTQIKTNKQKTKMVNITKQFN